MLDISSIDRISLTRQYTCDKLQDDLPSPFYLSLNPNEQSNFINQWYIIRINYEEMTDKNVIDHNWQSNY
jgi:hypothetical protein